MNKLKWRNCPLTCKLSLSMIILVIIAVTTVTLLSTLREQKSYRIELEKQAVLLIDAVTAAISNSLYYLNINEISDVITKLKKNSELLTFVRVYDYKGCVIAATDVESYMYHYQVDVYGNWLINQNHKIISWQTDSLLVSKAVSVENQILAAVSIKLSTKLLQDKIESVRNQGIILALVAIVFAVIFAFIISHSITKPLHKLIHLTKDISKGDLSQKIEVHGDVELALLGRAMEKMRTELKDLYSSLEQKVIDRTQALIKNEAELRRAKDKAEKANRTKNEFLTNMSHEIRTPINSIQGFSELLISTTDNPDHKKYLHYIRSASDSLLTLFNDVLDLSKIDADKLDIQPESVNIARVISKIEKFLVLKFREKEIDFKLEIDHNIPSELILDEIRVRQILINLLGNAIKFTSEGYVRLAVKVSAQLPLCEKTLKSIDKVNITFEIEDTGIGIPKEKLDSIFGDFIQGDGTLTRGYQGVGLGLAITKRLVKLMNGSISVYSKVGQGSIFRVHFFDVELADAVNHSNNGKLDERHISFESSTLLLVDENRSNRELIKEYLKNLPFSIIETENYKQTHKMLMEKPGKKKSFDQSRDWLKPDLILMNLKMSEFSNKKLSEMVKKAPHLSHIPIIAFGSSELSKNNDHKQSLASAYINQPFSKFQLIAELRNHLPHSLTDINDYHNRKMNGKHIKMFA